MSNCEKRLQRTRLSLHSHLHIVLHMLAYKTNKSINLAPSVLDLRAAKLLRATKLGHYASILFLKRRDISPNCNEVVESGSQALIFNGARYTADRRTS